MVQNVLDNKLLFLSGQERYMKIMTPYRAYPSVRESDSGSDHRWEVIIDVVTCDMSGLILGLRPANERRRYKVTPSLIGWVQPRISPVYPRLKP